MHTFIHPTKCGGTACERYFRDHYKQYIVGSGHHEKCNDRNNPIIIVREVRSRFFSMFKYWKNGAVDTQYKRDQKFIEKNKDVTILDFIRILKTNPKELYTGFTWNQHFSPVTDWIGNTNKKNIIIIKYESNLNEKIQTLITKLKIPNKNIVLPKVNTTKSIPSDQVFIDKYEKEVTEFIEVYFKKDLELWELINNSPEQFKMVI